MSLDAVAISAETRRTHRGLRRDAIGFSSSLAFGIGNAAPALALTGSTAALAATAGVGDHGPGIMLVSFVPMLCIAVAYWVLNRLDPDCGTAFAWVTRALGPEAGWVAGWAVIVSAVLVVAGVAQWAGIYTFRLFGASAAAGSSLDVSLMGAAWIALMTLVVWRGIELSARVQRVLVAVELAALVVFAVVALVKVYASHPAGSVHPAASWLNPFGVASLKAFTAGIVLATYAYLGWDAAVVVNEETEEPRGAPGRAAIISTLVLLAVFVLVSYAEQAFAGPLGLAEQPVQHIDGFGELVLFEGDACIAQELRPLLIRERWVGRPA